MNLNATWVRTIGSLLVVSAVLAGCATAAPHRVYVRIGPPAPVVETRVVAPGPNYVWVPGYQRWNGAAYVWVPGRWTVPPRARAVWVAGRWVRERRGWYWVEGRWR